MKNEVIIFRISEEEKIKLQQLAKLHHLSMSSYVRMKALTTKN
jgi:hypothetical protein